MRVARDRCLRRAARAADVRREGGVVVFEQRIGCGRRLVGQITQPALSDRVGQRRAIDERAARGSVDDEVQPAGALRPLEESGAQQSMVAIVRRLPEQRQRRIVIHHRQEDDGVALFEEMLQRRRDADALRLPFGERRTVFMRRCQRRREHHQMLDASRAAELDGVCDDAARSDEADHAMPQGLLVDGMLVAEDSTRGTGDVRLHAWVVRGRGVTVRLLDELARRDGEGGPDDDRLLHRHRRRECGRRSRLDNPGEHFAESPNP
jgi:hypothetical protein